jgi:hypothetical protein
MHKSLTNLFSPSLLFLLPGAHPFSIPTGGGSIQGHLLLLPFPAQLLDPGGAAPGNGARAGRVRKVAAWRAGRVGSAWRLGRAALAAQAWRGLGEAATRSWRERELGSGATARARRRQTREQRRAAWANGGAVARAEQSGGSRQRATAARAGVRELVERDVAARAGGDGAGGAGCSSALERAARRGPSAEMH